MRPRTLLAALWLAVAPVGDARNAVAAEPKPDDAMILGLVYDAKHAGLGGVSVVATCRCLAEPVTTHTNDNGLFRLAALPPGRYRLLFAQRDGETTQALAVLAAGERLRLRMPVTNRRGRLRSEARPNLVDFRATRLAGPSGGGGERTNREALAPLAADDFAATDDWPRSTIAADVGSGSYANVRAFIDGAVVPPAAVVQPAELVNYFDYAYAEPTGDKAMAVHWELATCPWSPDHVLARVGLQAKRMVASHHRGRNIVLLVDTGMRDQLDFARRLMVALIGQVRAEDRLAIVAYGGATGLVLPPTSGADHSALRGAMAELHAGVSYKGRGAALQLAYRVARESFVPGRANRIVVMTDGSSMLSEQPQASVVERIVDNRESGVSLSVLGLGSVHHGELAWLADLGGGNYVHADTFDAGRAALATEIATAASMAAVNAELQVEFNPDKVESYRVIGYGNRRRRDAAVQTRTGDFGFGQSTTVLFELVPHRQDRRARRRRNARRSDAPTFGAGQWMRARARYERPGRAGRRQVEVTMAGAPRSVATASQAFRFAAAVGEFGLVLLGDSASTGATLASARRLAAASLGPDPYGHRAAFVELVDRAARLR